MESANAQITQILDAVGRGQAGAASQLLPLVYDELRKLARARLARESPGHTLQPTELVHEAYVRLVGTADPGWNGRGHFFGAAAQAMRRILIEHARRKAGRPAGAPLDSDNADDLALAIQPPAIDLLALDEALDALAKDEPLGSQVVILRYFAGLTVDDVADVLKLSKRTVEREWQYARAWLLQRLAGRDTQLESL